MFPFHWLCNARYIYTLLFQPLGQCGFRIGVRLSEIGKSGALPWAFAKSCRAVDQWSCALSYIYTSSFLVEHGMQYDMQNVTDWLAVCWWSPHLEHLVVEVHHALRTAREQYRIQWLGMFFHELTSRFVAKSKSEQWRTSGQFWRDSWPDVFTRLQPTLRTSQCPQNLALWSTVVCCFVLQKRWPG